MNKQRNVRTLMVTGAATVAALAMLVTGTASAANGTYYSSKQPYIAPSDDVIAGYSAAPEGYEPVYTEIIARHGSRGLSSYKYDALLEKMGQTAAEVGGFVSDEARDTFMANVKAITAANVENGYGMLTGQGATQHQGIGARAYERNAQLFDEAAADGGTIAYESSGEARATESGENFKAGFDAASNGELADAYVTPSDAAGDGAAAAFQKSPDTLYFHKTSNPDGTKKTGAAADIASRYEQFIDDDDIIGNAEDYIEKQVDAVQEASYDLLSQIFTDDFLEAIDAGEYKWFNTSDGEEHPDEDEDGIDDDTGEDVRSCAVEGDPDEVIAEYGEDACGETGKSIESVVDAAMDLYNLYIIAADMTEENTGDHTFDFDQYFEDISQEDGETFAWILDMEDFYEKGPSYAGQNETYRIAQPLLDDFFASIDERMAGGDTVATFRFAHAETIMPFAALIKAPGSEVQAPAVEDPQGLDDVFTYENNPWRGESVTPMAANIQWDVYAKDGIDPATGEAYTPIVRMLYNETEVAFNSECTPIAEGSYWYKESELKSCLGLTESRVETDESPTIAVDDETPTTPDDGDATGDVDGDGDDGDGEDTTDDVADTEGQGDASPSSLATTGVSMTVPAIAAIALIAAGVTVAMVARRRQR